MSMFGSLGEMANLMKKFGEIQSNMKKMQAELAAIEVRGTSYSNIAEVVMSGDMVVKSVKLDPAALSAQNRELVENAVQEACPLAIVSRFRRVTLRIRGSVTTASYSGK